MVTRGRIEGHALDVHVGSISVVAAQGRPNVVLEALARLVAVPRDRHVRPHGHLDVAIILRELPGGGVGGLVVPPLAQVPLKLDSKLLLEVREGAGQLSRSGGAEAPPPITHLLEVALKLVLNVHG